MKILIVDDERDVAEIMEFLVREYFLKEVETQTAHSGNEAIEILKKNQSIDLCICDHNMPNGMGNEVLRFIDESKLKTKFVLCSTLNPTENIHLYPERQLFAHIQKPEIADGIVMLWKLWKKTNAKKVKKTIGNSEEFLPISVHILELMGKAPADLYIRIAESKFIKCLNSSENFLLIDKEKYISKSIHTLYILKGEHAQFINQVILDTVQKIQAKRDIPLPDKMSVIHSQLVELIKFTGITPELAETTKHNIQESVGFIMKSQLVNDFWKKLNFLGEYPSKLYTLHTLLASVVVKKLLWNSEETIFKMCIASFLQDIALDSIPLMEICDYQEFLEKQSNFTKAEIKKFHEHPQKAKEVLDSLREVPSDIDRILMDQLEMPNGKGFPRQLNAQQLTPLTCIFLITGILARSILRDGDNFDLNLFITQIEAKGYSQGNFTDAFEAIKFMRT